MRIMTNTKAVVKKEQIVCMSPHQILFSVVGLIKVGKETENGRAKKIITGRIQDDAAVRAGYAGGIGPGMQKI